MRSIRPYLKRIALDIGILEGSQKYVKFILLSRSRTGSNYLRSLLNSHSQIRVFGELFKKQDHINWDFPDFYRARKERFSLQTKPILFLEKEIFRIYPKNIKAVGFKIFYYHAQNDNWKILWTYLKDQKDFKVIHLKRKNILKNHLSRKRADYGGEWINLTGEKEKIGPITLDYEECLKDFITTRRWEKEYDALFENHEMLSVYYEDLRSDSYQELRRIQEFLGVQEEELKASTHQQTILPLSQAIANYHKLKQQFKDTAWAEFFEE